MEKNRDRMKDFGIVFEKDGITTTYWQIQYYSSVWYKCFTVEELYQRFKEKWMPYHKERYSKWPWAYHRPVCMVVRR